METYIKKMKTFNYYSAIIVKYSMESYPPNFHHGLFGSGLAAMLKDLTISEYIGARKLVERFGYRLRIT